MALNENAIFTAATGFVYTGAVGTAVKPTPTQIDTFSPSDPVVPAGWVDLGHTSREDLPEFGYEGGEVETRGTWRNAAVREVTTEQAVDYVVLRLHQFDEDSLSLYYGSENISTVTGEFSVGGDASSSIERALLIVVCDGPHRIAFHAPRASLRREEELTMATDEFAVLPLRATFLSLDGTPARFSWISLDTGVNPEVTP